MSEKFWDRLNYVVGILAIGVVFGMTAFMASIEIKDLDLWLHLKMGQYISENKVVPDHDVLSCSISGKPWVNHEWLFQVILYQVWHQWDFNGLINMQVGIVFFTMLILLLIGYSKERQFLTAGALFLILLVYQTRFTIRPDIYSLLFFVLFIWILSWFINKRWSMWALVVIQILWTNIHGFFFFGPLLVALAIISEFLKRRVPLPWEWNQSGRLNDDEYARIKKTFLLLLLACCVNPLTFQGAWYPIGVFLGMGSGSSKIFFAHITELQKPITLATIWTGQNSFYKAMIIFSALILFFNRRRIDISTVFIWVIFLVFSLAAVRNMVFFSVAAYLVLMANASTVQWERIVPIYFTQKRFKFITAIFVKVIFMFFIINEGTKIASNGYFDFDTFERKSEFGDVSKRSFPYHAVDFLVNNQVKGNFFNDFNSGAYLIGRCYPNIKVYIDGRTEEYGSDFFERYQKIWREGDAKVFQEDAQKYNITGVFLNNNNQLISEKTIKMFYNLPDWKVVYFNYDGIIFLKNTPSNKTWIDRFAIDFKTWQPPKFDLQRLGTKRIDPIPLTNRAYMLKAMGLYDLALKQSKEALKISPDDIDAYKILGEIYENRADYRRAFECYRVAVILNPNNTKMRLNLAEAYENINDLKGALKIYQRIQEVDSSNAKVYFGFARVYATLGKIDQAKENLTKAQSLDPKDKVAVKRIRDIIAKNKKAKSLTGVK